jgi:hypothetical protein
VSNWQRRRNLSTMDQIATSQYALVEGSALLTTLVSVGIVCRFYRVCIPSSLAQHISDFTVFSPSCTLFAAAAEGHPRLMRLLCARSAHSSDPLDHAYVASDFNKAVSAAPRSGDYYRVEVLMRLFPDVVVTDAVLHTCSSRGPRSHFEAVSRQLQSCLLGRPGVVHRGLWGSSFCGSAPVVWLNRHVQSSPARGRTTQRVVRHSLRRRRIQLRSFPLQLTVLARVVDQPFMPTRSHLRFHNHSPHLNKYRHFRHFHEQSFALNGHVRYFWNPNTIYPHIRLYPSKHAHAFATTNSWHD